MEGQMKVEEMERTQEKTKMHHPEIASGTRWLVAGKDLIAREKEFTRQRDALSAARRALPWVKVEKEYVFEGPGGKETLADLFADRSQLIIYHFMLGPTWEEGCKSCSFLPHHFDGTPIHLAHRDVTFAVVSRAPMARIQAFQKGMGWRVHWRSAFAGEVRAWRARGWLQGGGAGVRTARCCMGGGRWRRLAGRSSAGAASILPGAALVLLRKCPLCLAAWLTVATGIAIPAAAAAWVR